MVPYFAMATPGQQMIDLSTGEIQAIRDKVSMAILPAPARSREDDSVPCVRKSAFIKELLDDIFDWMLAHQ